MTVNTFPLTVNVIGPWLQTFSAFMSVSRKPIICLPVEKPPATPTSLEDGPTLTSFTKMFFPSFMEMAPTSKSLIQRF